MTWTTSSRAVWRCQNFQVRRGNESRWIYVIPSVITEHGEPWAHGLSSPSCWSWRAPRPSGEATGGRTWKSVTSGLRLHENHIQISRPPVNQHSGGKLRGTFSSLLGLCLFCIKGFSGQALVPGTFPPCFTQTELREGKGSGFQHPGYCRGLLTKQWHVISTQKDRRIVSWDSCIYCIWKTRTVCSTTRERYFLIFTCICYHHLPTHNLLIII